MWQRVKRCSFAGTRCWWYIRWIVLLRFRWITDMNNSAPSAICCYRLFQWHDAFMANVFVSKPTRVFTVFMFLWSTIIHYCSAVWYMAQTRQQRGFSCAKIFMRHQLAKVHKRTRLCSSFLAGKRELLASYMVVVYQLLQHVYLVLHWIVHNYLQ